MKIEEIPAGLSYAYVKYCECCGQRLELLTKRDDDPEYYAEVYLQCTCGNYISFDLPVN